MEANNNIDGNAALQIQPPRAPALDSQVGQIAETDPHEQLRHLYMALLTKQDRFDEFKQLLALYPTEASVSEDEPANAASLRSKLNQRISEWIGGPFEGLGVTQLLLWRAIVVEQRFNVALSPWKESN